MKKLKIAQHDIKRDIHNILCLLKFIRDDKELENSENKIMLMKCLEREESLNLKLDLVSRYLDGGKTI